MSKNKMCAGRDGSTAVCNGDSSSAIYDSDKRVIAGVTSYGYRDNPAEEFVPPVFARISAQLFAIILS